MRKPDGAVGSGSPGVSRLANGRALLARWAFLYTACAQVTKCRMNKEAQRCRWVVKAIVSKPQRK